MKTMRLTYWLSFVLLAGGSALAVDLAGTVRQADGETAEVVLASDLIPAVGDKLDIFFKLPGGDDEILVGDGSVTAIGADSVKVKIERATGTVTKDHLVKIHSASPQKRVAAKAVTPDGNPPGARPLPPELMPVEIKPGAGKPAENVPKAARPISAELMPVEITPDQSRPRENGAEAERSNSPGTPGRTVPDGTGGPPPPKDSPAGPDGRTARDHFNDGFKFHKAGDRDGAAAAYTRAIELDPSLASAYYNRACINLMKKNYDGLIRDATRALELGHRSQANLYCFRGTGWAGKGLFDKAVADQDKAIAVEPDHALAYNNRGNDYYRKGDMARATRDCSRSIALDPASPLPWYNRGYVYYSLREYAKAAADWRKAMELQPDYKAELEPLIAKMGNR
jgi:Flp pilus assembly protein TadD